MCECAGCGGLDVGLYLRLRRVVCIVSVVVFTWHCGFYAGRVEEATQLLLLALSKAVNDAARLLLLLYVHTHTENRRHTRSETHIFKYYKNS